VRYSSRIYLLVYFVCLAQLCSCQPKKVLAENVTQGKRTYLQEGDYRFIAYDKLDHLYLVTSANEVLQFKDNTLLFRYSNRRLGDVTKIDVSNPQKILVYYGEFYQVVFLDNTLSEIKRLDLEALGYWDVQGIALSRDNQIWFYDPVNVRLRKINTNGDIQLSSNELYDYGFSDTFVPDVLVANGNIYVYDNQGLKVFDEFGVWQKNIPLDNQGLQGSQRFLIYKDGNKLYSYMTEVEMLDPIQVITSIDPAVTGFFLTKESVLLIDEVGFYKVEY